MEFVTFFCTRSSVFVIVPLLFLPQIVSQIWYLLNKLRKMKKTTGDILIVGKRVVHERIRFMSSANFIVAESEPRRVRPPVRRRLNAAARRPHLDLQSDTAAPAAANNDDDMVISLTNQVFMEFVTTLNTHVRSSLWSACVHAGVDEATSARILARLDLSDEVLARMFG